MIVRKSRKTHVEREGVALVFMALGLASVLALSASLLVLVRSHSKEQRGSFEDQGSRYVAQAGLAQAMYQLQRSTSGVVGSPGHPASFGTSSYVVEAENVGSDLIRLRSLGIEDRERTRLELVVRSVPSTIWRFGAFGREFLHLDSNARVDSYDSTLGSYASQAVNSSGSSQYALSEGDVGSNGSISLDQNANVWGDAAAGPGHVTAVLGNAAVSGSTTPRLDSIELPEVPVPSYTSYGALTVTGSVTIAASNRAYTTLRVNANKTLNVVGPANLVINSLDLRSGGRIVVDPTNGPVTLYVLDNFLMNSNTSMASTRSWPRDLRINLLSDNVINPEVDVDLDVVDFDSNSKIFGYVYAPNAAITLDSNFEMFGSLVARSLDIDSNARFHFDEALIAATASGDPEFETVSWREIAE